MDPLAGDPDCHRGASFAEADGGYFTPRCSCSDSRVTPDPALIWDPSSEYPNSGHPPPVRVIHRERPPHCKCDDGDCPVLLSITHRDEEVDYFSSL